MFGRISYAIIKSDENRYHIYIYIAFTYFNKYTTKKYMHINYKQTISYPLNVLE